MASRRPRHTGWVRVKQPISTSYIDVSAGISLAAGLNANYSLLLSSDSPNKALVSDMAGIVSQCENNTRIIKKGSFLHLNFLATVAPAVVGIWVYLNKKGMVTAPVDTDDFSQGPTTEDNAQLREQTIFYKHFPLDINSFRSIRIPLGSRRNNWMTDPTTTLVIVIDNLSATAAIQWNGYGRIKLVEG